MRGIRKRFGAVQANDGVDLTVAAGTVHGIVGENGAGKSTLVKLVKRTIRPTEGTVEVLGRMAALELGLGFHPDFTGRQNLFTSGALLGLGAAQIERLVPEIEDFAEIGPYLDDPVRTYSSGMQLRLAFSLATAVRPDVLLIDEALAVGDAYFQQKCMMRIRQFRKQGTTLLFDLGVYVAVLGAVLAFLFGLRREAAR